MRGAIKRRADFRGHCPLWVLLSLGLASPWGLADTPSPVGDPPVGTLAGTPADSLAGTPTEYSVTVYRAPDRESGSIDLDYLGGFALVSETRTVHLPAGTSRLRFEGVADGIEPVSAIVTGLPDGVLEKNREGKLLSPAALIDAAVGKPVTLLRTNKKTGKLSRLPGKILSDAEGGVVFESSEGIEALRCSGLPETLGFSGVGGLTSTPTLSVLVRSATPLTRTVTLSYLARGFDWAADYSAILSADGKSMSLGAWVTLANGNGAGFPQAHTQVVAGRVNRESGDVEPLDPGGPILARCWRRGSTSDLPEDLQMSLGGSLGAAYNGVLRKSVMSLAAPAAFEEVVVTGARRVQQEQLGDLKLYRVPDRTTLASRQSKQVRLLDRSAIPVSLIYGADLPANEPRAAAPATRLLRTKNNAANHLGLPLPSGRVAVFARRGEAELLLHESDLSDLAVDEEVEIKLGESTDVQVTAVQESTHIDPARAQTLPLVPGVSLRSTKVDSVNRIEISNARAQEIHFELRLSLPPGGRVVRADHPLGMKNGRPIFRLTIPADESATLRYQATHTADTLQSPAS